MCCIVCTCVYFYVYVYECVRVFLQANKRDTTLGNNSSSCSRRVEEEEAKKKQIQSFSSARMRVKIENVRAIRINYKSKMYV